MAQNVEKLAKNCKFLYIWALSANLVKSASVDQWISGQGFETPCIYNNVDKSGSQNLVNIPKNHPINPKINISSRMRAFIEFGFAEGINKPGNKRLNFLDMDSSDTVLHTSLSNY